MYMFIHVYVYVYLYVYVHVFMCMYVYAYQYLALHSRIAALRGTLATINGIAVEPARTAHLHSDAHDGWVCERKREVSVSATMMDM